MTPYQKEQKKISKQERRLIVAMLPFLEAYTVEHAEDKIRQITGNSYEVHRDAVIEFIKLKRCWYRGVIGTRYSLKNKGEN